MAHEWEAVVTTQDQASAKSEAKRLVKLGYRAKALLNIRTHQWEVCVSPPGDATAALHSLMMH